MRMSDYVSVDVFVSVCVSVCMSVDTLPPIWTSYTADMWRSEDNYSVDKLSLSALM